MRLMHKQLMFHIFIVNIEFLAKMGHCILFLFYHGELIMEGNGIIHQSCATNTFCGKLSLKNGWFTMTLKGKNVIYQNKLVILLNPNVTDSSSVKLNYYQFSYYGHKFFIYSRLILPVILTIFLIFKVIKKKGTQFRLLKKSQKDIQFLIKQ